MLDYAISVANLHKSYGSLHVLRGIELDVLRGEVFGLLGPNGAGKTTLIHTILGLLQPDEGSVRVLGSEDRLAVSGRVGYLPERVRYHGQFTAREYLRALGKLSNLSGTRLLDRIDAVLDLVGLQPAADRRIGTYSKGMLQRIGIAQAVLHEPDLLIVDEPGSGLDPGGQREMVTLLRALSESGHTILLCTHQLTDVARLCDRIGVLINGRLDHRTSMAELHAQGYSTTIHVTDLPLETATELGHLSPHIRTNHISVTLFPSDDRLLAEVLRMLLRDNVPIQSVIPEADALEQFYLNAVNNGTPPSALQDRRTEDALERLIEDH